MKRTEYNSFVEPKLTIKLIERLMCFIPEHVKINPNNIGEFNCINDRLDSLIILIQKYINEIDLAELNESKFEFEESQYVKPQRKRSTQSLCTTTTTTTSTTSIQSTSSENYEVQQKQSKFNRREIVTDSSTQNLIPIKPNN
ncbi:MAG: hypothetical protein ACK5XF_04255 [Neisseriaceae bacterium]|jgi:hypothetical protein